MKWSVGSWMLLATLIFAVGCHSLPETEIPPVGYDLAPVFRRAAAGQPITVAAIGGSITQADHECWINDLLRKRYPQSTITTVNAGMSATGSELGVFRLRKDVLDHRPDLVLIEFAVNDNGLPDEAAIRYVESLVVRLKSLPKPPAVVLVRAASRTPAPDRLQPVAEHYRLLHVDTQAPLEKHLAEQNLQWLDLMTDDVHPNETGHAFYGRTILGALEPFMAAAEEEGPSSGTAYLPAPLSARPLILDGDMQLLSETLYQATGWRPGPAPQDWWRCFFPGAVWADGPDAELMVPVAARMAGVLYLLKADDQGSFYLTLDEGLPQLVNCAYRGGYEYRVFGPDLAEKEHRISALTRFDSKRPVGIGWLLTAQREGDFWTPAEQGDYPAARLKKWRFAAIPAAEWEWSGPYGGERPTLEDQSDLEVVFPPELEQGEWRKVGGYGEVVDFAALTGRNDRGVAYARTTLQSRRGGPRMLALKLDYFAKVWLNGKLIRTIADGHGNTQDPVYLPVVLQPGPNELLIKLHSGSRGNQFSLAVEEEVP